MEQFTAFSKKCSCGTVLEGFGASSDPCWIAGGHARCECGIEHFIKVRPVKWWATRDSNPELAD